MKGERSFSAPKSVKDQTVDLVLLHRIGRPRLDQGPPHRIEVEAGVDEVEVRLKHKLKLKHRPGHSSVSSCASSMILLLMHDPRLTSSQDEKGSSVPCQITYSPLEPPEGQMGLVEVALDLPPEVAGHPRRLVRLSLGLLLKQHGNIICTISR